MGWERIEGGKPRHQRLTGKPQPVRCSSAPWELLCLQDWGGGFFLPPCCGQATDVPHKEMDTGNPRNQVLTDSNRQLGPQSGLGLLVGLVELANEGRREAESRVVYHSELSE